ncbi:MAG: hypothetical protein CM15mP71_5730 [Candidatus Poseidoniales archaeon]|nr:MAG: hypothetical protein CM15mP71_5730 [Candidatus Poseidoniales archaeon]
MEIVLAIALTLMMGKVLIFRKANQLEAAQCFLTLDTHLFVYEQMNILSDYAKKLYFVYMLTV